jgi:hypothetical protein
MAGLQRYRDTKPPDRAWCHPSTWLHQERWNDKPAPNNGKQPANGNGHANGHSVIGFARGTREWWESVREMRGYYFAPGEREKFEKQFGGAT